VVKTHTLKYVMLTSVESYVCIQRDKAVHQGIVLSKD